MGGTILTVLEILGHRFSRPRLADPLNQPAVILGRLEEHAVHKVTVVVPNANHGLLLVAAPARMDVVDDSVVAGDGGKTAEDGGEVGGEEVLHVHPRADVDDALEGLGLGVLDDAVLFCGL